MSENDYLKNIDYKLTKLTSFKHVFLRGIINGLGTFIGATIVAAVLLAVLSRFIDSVEDVEVIQDIVDSVDTVELKQTSELED